MSTPTLLAEAMQSWSKLGPAQMVVWDELGVKSAVNTDYQSPVSTGHAQVTALEGGRAVMHVRADRTIRFSPTPVTVWAVDLSEIRNAGGGLRLVLRSVFENTEYVFGNLEETPANEVTRPARSQGSLNEETLLRQGWTRESKSWLVTLPEPLDLESWGSGRW